MDSREIVGLIYSLNIINVIFYTALPHFFLKRFNYILPRRGRNSAKVKLDSFSRDCTEGILTAIKKNSYFVIFCCLAIHIHQDKIIQTMCNFFVKLHNGNKI